MGKFGSLKVLCNKNFIFIFDHWYIPKTDKKER